MLLTITSEDIERANERSRGQGGNPFADHSFTCPTAQALNRRHWDGELIAEVGTYYSDLIRKDTHDKVREWRHSFELQEQISRWDNGNGFMPGEYLLTEEE